MSYVFWDKHGKRACCPLLICGCLVPAGKPHLGICPIFPRPLSLPDIPMFARGAVVSFRHFPLSAARHGSLVRPNRPFDHLATTGFSKLTSPQSLEGKTWRENQSLFQMKPTESLLDMFLIFSGRLEQLHESSLLFARLEQVGSVGRSRAPP